MKKLNPSQEKAIKQNQGQLLVIAGAGTGKTSTIVAKIANIIDKKLALPHEIACLTFTEKAAQEMEERIDLELPIGVFGVTTSTFHSFAEKILREECHHIGFSPDFKILNESSKIYFLKKNIFNTSLKNLVSNPKSTSFLEPILHHFSRLQDEFITPKEYLHWANLQTKRLESLSDNDRLEMEDDLKSHQALAEGYEQFLKLKKENNYVDFGDLVYYVIKIFRENRSILSKYQKKFKHIFVDEFQDTNLSQYELIKLLCPPSLNPNLTVVGDDSQGIYKFRGATVSNILNFQKDYIEAKQVVLNDNYRSSQPILDTAYKVIKNNDPDTLEFKLGISKLLKSHIDEIAEAVVFRPFFKEHKEAKWIAQEIKRLIQEENIKPADIAILTRAKHHQDALKQALIAESIPYHATGSDNFFNQNEIRDLIAFLQILLNPTDSQALHRVMSMKLVDVPQKTLFKIESLAKDLVMPVFQTIEILKAQTEDKLKNEKILKVLEKHNILDFDDLSQVFKVLELIYKYQDKTRNFNAGQLLYGFLENILWIENIKQIKQDSVIWSKEDNNIAKFFNFLKNLENKIDDVSVSSVLEYLEIIKEIEDDIKNDDLEEELTDGVKIMTAHASKGLEFSAVFIPSLSEGRFPSKNKTSKYKIPDELIKDTLSSENSHIQEERRLFYVAMTRAKNRLYLTASKYYGKNVRKSNFSRFLSESLDNFSKAKIEEIVDEEKNQISIFDFKKEDEDNFIVKSNDEVTLSYTRINDYEICPLKYKYKYVLNVPYEYKESAQIGNIIHLTLQKFYKLYEEGVNVDENVLINLFHESFKPGGFESKSEMTHQKELIKNMLLTFYKNFHNKNIKVLAVESNFKIKIGPKVHMTGKIDRIDQIKDGMLEIVDYKTGKTKKINEIKKDPQLSIYALAVKNDSKYNINLNKIKLSYYYLNEKQPITISKSEEEIEENLNKMIKVANDIKENKFDAKVGKHCDTCEFKRVCNAWVKN